MYCINCEKEVGETLFTEMENREVHWYTYRPSYWPGGIDNLCYGPFAYCPPPPVPALPLQEPDEEFMELIESDFLI